MKFHDFDIQEPKSYASLLDWARKAHPLLQALCPVETPSVVPDVRPDGTRYAAKVGGGPPAVPIITALVVGEGLDALICTVDNGATTFYVMKPEPLRMAWQCGVGAIGQNGELLGAAQETDQTIWDSFGYVVRMQNELLLPEVVEENQVVWPPWVDSVGPYSTTTPVNQIRVPNLVAGGDPRQVNVICARLANYWSIDIADLSEGGDEQVSYVDITPGRAWTPLSVITQDQEVRDITGVLGYVDNSPTNS